MLSAVYYGLPRSPEFSEPWVEPITPPTTIHLPFYRILAQGVSSEYRRRSTKEGY